MKGNLMNMYLDEDLMEKGKASKCKRNKRRDG